MIQRMILVAVFVLAFATHAAAQSFGWAFTYQGKLEVGGVPANGVYDLRFQLWSQESAGVQIGPQLCVDDLTVEDGIFTVKLDFDAMFSGSPRFMEIQVRAGAAGDCSTNFGFTTLGPRQELTPTPHATYARIAANAISASDAQSLGGRPSASFPTLTGNNTFTGVNVFNGSFTGIGCSTPLTSAEAFGIQKAENPGGYVGMYVRATNASSRPFYGYAAGGSPRWWTQLNGQTNSWAVTNNGTDLLTIAQAGNVGLGVTTPTERLDLLGNIRFGNSGEVYAVGAPSNQRMIAGRVFQNGTVGAGTGFTSTRISAGYYRITFSTPFPVAPVATANSVGTPRTVYIFGMTTNVCDIIANGPAGTPQDCDIMFTVIGSR